MTSRMDVQPAVNPVAGSRNSVNFHAARKLSQGAPAEFWEMSSALVYVAQAAICKALCNLPAISKLEYEVFVLVDAQGLELTLTCWARLVRAAAAVASLWSSSGLEVIILYVAQENHSGTSKCPSTRNL